MIIEGKTKQERLDFFQDLYSEAESASATLIEGMSKHYEQYKGSKKIDGSTTEATQIRNITYELIESQVTGYIPSPQVAPKMYSERAERCAKSIETLLRNKRDELPFEKMNDIDERYTPIYGASIWLIEWDNSISDHNTVGDVKVSCISPKRFLGQPNIYDVADMEYCFIKFDATKEDIVRKYGVSVEIAEETESDEGVDDRTATLYVCYYKNDEDKVCQFVWSGDTVLLDLEDYYARKRRVCRKCGKREELCTCEHPKYELMSEEYEELTRDVVLSDGSVIPAMSEVMKDGVPVMETQKQQMIDDNGELSFQMYPDGSVMPLMVDVQVPKMAPTKLPFFTPSILPVVIRKNTSEEDCLFGQSDCEFIRPQQQGINKLESRIHKKTMNAGVYPIVPRSATVDLDNSIFEKVFRISPEERGMYGTLDLQVDVSRDTAQSERLYEQAKRILGISDSFQGQYDGSAQSGRAKQLQIQQAAGRLDSKRRMKNAAYAEIDRIIFQYYLAYADEPRPATYRDAQGRRQNVTFNRYDFIERDEAGEYYYNDGFLFSADATIDVERSRETLWAENRQNFQSGAYGDPSLPQTQLIFWQNQMNAHYPWAQENVERLREEIEKQRQMQEMQAQLEQMQAQNNELTGQLSGAQEQIKTHEEYEDYLKRKIGGARQ